jgi:hypothetical protein
MTAVYDQNTGQWTQRPAHEGPVTGGLMRSGSMYLRKPGANETVAGNMAQLQSSGNPLMRLAGKQGEAFAARRGLQNSSMAAQASQQAALQAAMPIAQADAQIHAQASAQNAEALNAAAIAEMNRQTASAQGGGVQIGPNQLDADIEFERQQQLMRLQSELNISEAEAGRIFDREMTLGEREWRSRESGLDRGLSREEWAARSAEADRDRGWRSGESALDRDFGRETRAWERENMNSEQRFSMFRDMMQMMGTTLFSDPSYWRDQNGASGFIDFFTSEFGSVFDRFFGRNRGGGG